MQDRASELPPLTTTPPASDAIRMQILATEHWSLLATRGMTWNEMFTRASMYLTLLSAAIVALALVAQATNFGPTFRLFALLLLPVVLILGLGTQIRLGDARREDVWLLLGMNRLRHAYLELAPELEPYFVTDHHDDQAGLMRSYLLAPTIRPTRILSATPTLVGLINAVVCGVLVGLLVLVLGAPSPLAVGAGIVAALVFAGISAAIPVREITRMQTDWQPRFPH